MKRIIIGLCLLLALCPLAFAATGVDSTTQVNTFIEYAHHEVHAGSSFEHTDAEDFTTGETKSFLLITPDTKKWAHFYFDAVGELEYNIDFYEDATPDNDGGLVQDPPVINRNRNQSANTCTMCIYSNPTVGGGSKGSLIRQHHAGSGKKSGGDSRSAGEIILKQNTKYWVDITNSTTSNNYIGWSVIWYEHENL